MFYTVGDNIKKQFDSGEAFIIPTIRERQCLVERLASILCQLVGPQPRLGSSGSYIHHGERQEGQPGGGEGLAKVNRWLQQGKGSPIKNIFVEIRVRKIN